ncbi:Mfa1 family fimbria major subunit [Alistipes senegalensis]|uniref:Mfa1 family fimbria major subunit n=1 Tax=Alistipes senegalensis TaxID=1288121 RepID=UPI0018AB5EF6
MSALASLLMAGCSPEGFDPNGEDNGSNETTTSYLAVNLISSDATKTRTTGISYEDGSADENKVSKVRFYFFDGLGAASNVKNNNGTYVNYFDWEPEEQGTSGTGDVEKILTAKIVINTTAGDGIPQRMAAVINPDGVTGLGAVSQSLTSLKGIVQDYAAPELTSEGKFVMFNAVYPDGDTGISTVAIPESKLKKKAEDAINDPVIIYVERSVAKVKVSLDPRIGFNNNLLELKDKDGNPILVKGADGIQTNVYLKIDKWALTANTTNGRLVKKINPGWNGSWWYNNHCSFWAINSTSATNHWLKYNEINTDLGTSLYTNENAQKNDIDATGNAKENTKVILKGTICTLDGTGTGTPVTIARHGGAHFVDTKADGYPNLRTSILNMMAGYSYTYYCDVTVGGVTQRTQIGIEDIEIKKAEQVTSENSHNNCYVYAQLTAAAKTKTWYASDAADAEPIEPSVIDATLKDKKTGSDKEYIIDRPLLWVDGMTYYYYEIDHIENQNDPEMKRLKGVVRNHIYATNITKIAGLGTPVYNPDDIIYPEKPEANDHYIAAQINILSWRVVKQDYELEW